MGASERESRISVIEIHIPPRAGVMAGTAIRPKLTAMSIIRGVAGKTIGRRAFVDSIGVAGGTRDPFMASGQPETGQVVVEVHILPIGGVMAFFAIHAHLPLMDIQMA